MVGATGVTWLNSSSPMPGRLGKWILQIATGNGNISLLQQITGASYLSVTSDISLRYFVPVFVLLGESHRLPFKTVLVLLWRHEHADSTVTVSAAELSHSNRRSMTSYRAPGWAFKGTSEECFHTAPCQQGVFPFLKQRRCLFCWTCRGVPCASIA